MRLELSHIAIAHQKIDSIMERLNILGLEIEKTQEVPSEKVRVAMVSVPVSKEFRIEVLEPRQSDSPIAKFLEKRPAGGIHHLSFEVQHLERWIGVLEKAGIEILPPGVRTAARGRAVFIHPKDMGGILVELEELK